MALFAFKDFCIDANDPERLGRFWAKLLGLEFHLQAGGDAYLTGPSAQHTIWINGVPERKSVKHRTHLDINAESVPDLVALGAVVVDANTFRWTVMADPEGGEFCVFVDGTRNGAQRALRSLAFDCSSREAAFSTARWWAECLGAECVRESEDVWSVIKIPAAPFDSLDFAPVPEPKTVKNRVHIDVTAALENVIASGARVVRPSDEMISWTVCEDPDGNEFCVFAPK